MARSIRKPVVVIGSINMDLVCRVPAMVKPGQTLLGSELVTIPGGKGANQAVAAARLGAEVYMIGRVGSDDFGDRLLTGLKQHQVNMRHVTVTEGVSSGCAIIMVDGAGENAIIVAPGANSRVTPADLDRAEEVIAKAACVVMQLEIPLQTVEHAVAMCRRLGVYCILDPAPAPPEGLPASLYKVDLLTPNQGEAVDIMGGRQMGRARRTQRADAKQLAGDLVARGARSVVLKLGSKGAMLVDKQIEHVPPFKIDVVDTTAAGDAFTAALAVGKAEGRSLPESIRFANAAGALTCTAFGAQPSLPTREAVNDLLRKQV